MSKLPRATRDEIAALSRKHLEAVIAIESSSDETSSAIPSTEGQRVLSQHLESFFTGLGGQVRVDRYANVIARFAGRGEHADLPPLALMIHLDTARGSLPCDRLELHKNWDGTAIPYPQNKRLQVSVENYPCTAPYLGHDLLHGGGEAPFGLDDKLGLAHMMTLAKLLADHPEIPHRPLLLIGRPDEEIGREDALIGLAKWLADQGVNSGYTVDGLAPFEVNMENFNGRAAQMRFPTAPMPDPHALAHEGEVLEIVLLGVNTHGATAKEEGHRDALRFAVELMTVLTDLRVQALALESDPIRDGDGLLRIWIGDGVERTEVEAALERVVGPHVARGAGWKLRSSHLREGNGAVGQLLNFVREFVASRTDMPLLCEDSEAFQGYSHPYRVRSTTDEVQLDIRIRDFDTAALEMRTQHLRSIAGARAIEFIDQYNNMAPKLAKRVDLLENALDAAIEIGVTARPLPIRGGTGVDPFLDRGVFVANLGTGYFAPESEKEFTSMQFLAQHALWLIALVQR